MRRSKHLNDSPRGPECHFSAAQATWEKIPNTPFDKEIRCLDQAARNVRNSTAKVWECSYIIRLLSALLMLGVYEIRD